MLWLVVAVSSYSIMAVVSLVDKYLLTKTTLSPKLYAFYIGTLQILILILIPFVGFYLPEKKEIFLSLLSGTTFIFGLYWFFRALQSFEASRVVPAIGGLTPLFSLGLIYIFSLGKETLFFSEMIAFLFLILGSILINIEKGKLINLKSFKFSVPAAFFLALSFVSIKYVYLVQPFWNGLIWRSMGSFLAAACFFVFFPEIKKELFKNRTSKGSESKNIRSSLPFAETRVGEEEGKILFAKQDYFPKKTFFILVLNQIAGATAGILQNWAIFLAPLIYIPFVHALQGVQYSFVLVFALFLSFKFPQILKEETTKQVIFQKIVAILLIATGLALIVLK